MIIFIIPFPVKSLMSDNKIQQQILINMKYFMFSLQKQEKKNLNKCCENVGHVFVEKIIILRIILVIIL